MIYWIPAVSAVLSVREVHKNACEGKPQKADFPSQRDSQVETQQSEAGAGSAEVVAQPALCCHGMSGFARWERRNGERMGRIYRKWVRWTAKEPLRSATWACPNESSAIKYNFTLVWMSSYSDSEPSSDFDTQPRGALGPGPRRSQRQRTTAKYAPLSYNESAENSDACEAGEEASSGEEEEVVSMELLSPPIESILGRKEGLYLVKYKDRSYLHLQWLKREDILNHGRSGKIRLSRFEREAERRQEEEEDRYFDPAFIEVDRVLCATEMFPIIHPRQAAMVLNQWQGKCSAVLTYLVNYRRQDTPYGVYFLQTPDHDPEYATLVSYPVDFTIIHNRIYNGYYTAPKEFWLDLGFLFKNCQAYYTNRLSDMRVIGDTLRQMAIHLYKQWHAECLRDGLDPGPLSLRWVTLVNDFDVMSVDFLTAEFDKVPFTAEEEEQDRNLNEQHLTPEELQAVDLNAEVEKLYLVKWKNLSYMDSTWESEKHINVPGKILDFSRFNKALDVQARQQMTDLTANFSRFMGHQEAQQPGKRAKYSLSQGQMRSLMQSLDFPSYDFNTPVVQFPASPKFKEGRELREYQIQGLNWLLRNWHEHRNSILADEMGLGKTIQALSFFNTLMTVYHLRGPFLVLAPLSTLAHWKKIAEDWTPMNVVVYHDPKGSEGREFCREYESYYTDIMKKGTTSRKSKLVKFHVVITSFEVFMQDFEPFFQEIPFQFIVIDEAHRLKNKQAKILSYLGELPCRRYALLTGTPLQNNTEELWSLLHFIEPDQFGSLASFMSKYGSLSSQEQVTQLQYELKPFLLRRLKEEVEDSIPPLQETVIDVELTTTQKTYYRAIYERNRAFLCRGIQGVSIPALNNMELQLRKCCNHPFLIKGVEAILLMDCRDEQSRMARMVESSGKMVLLDKLLPKLRADGKKILIFSQFTQMLNLLEEYLNYKQARFERLDGSVKCNDRQAAIDRFNGDLHQRDVFLLSTRAGGLGINLTSAQVVIIFDSDWNPQNDVQATARAHRIGQTQEVQVYRLITARTYEAQMFERASKKLGLEQALFSKDERREVENLLRFGAYSILDEDTSKSQHFVESNIEEILEKNSRVVNYSIIRGCYSLGKSSFISHTADQSIDVNDPEFWSKILPPQTSPASRLLTKLNDQSFNVKSHLDEFMQELTLAVNDMVAAKGDLNTYNYEEEELLIQLISQVTQTKVFSKEQRQLAVGWLNELYKPARNSRNRPAVLTALSDSEEEKGKKKLPFSTYGGTGLICAECAKEGCGWFCIGPCRRSFHTPCLGKADSQREIVNEELEREAVIRRIADKWMCDECKKMQSACFVCGEKGGYRHTKTATDTGKRTTRKGSGLIKCSISTCGKSYHSTCVKGTGKRLICPRHMCGICSQSSNSKSLLQCIKCPNAFHVKCYKRQYVRLNKRYIICHSHKTNMQTPTYPALVSKTELKETAKLIKNKVKEVSEDYLYLSLLDKEEHKKGRKRGASKSAPEPAKRPKVSKGKSPEQAKMLLVKFGLVPAEEFDYTVYQGDWCRYCGARRSSLFSTGPWGPHTLCVAHYVKWNKKVLTFEGHSDLPHKPIDLTQNTELSYLYSLHTSQTGVV